MTPNGLPYLRGSCNYCLSFSLLVTCQFSASSRYRCWFLSSFVSQSRAESLRPEHEITVDIHASTCDSTTWGPRTEHIDTSRPCGSTIHLRFVIIRVVIFILGKSCKVIGQTIHTTRRSYNHVVHRRWSIKRWWWFILFEVWRVETWVPQHMNRTLYSIGKPRNVSLRGYSEWRKRGVSESLVTSLRSSCLRSSCLEAFQSGDTATR